VISCTQTFPAGEGSSSPSSRREKREPCELPNSLPLLLPLEVKTRACPGLIANMGLLVPSRLEQNWPKLIVNVCSCDDNGIDENITALPVLSELLLLGGLQWKLDDLAKPNPAARARAGLAIPLRTIMCSMFELDALFFNAPGNVEEEP
jgi:hypothetical protein